MLIYKGMNMIKFIKSFFTKRESKFEHPLDAVTTPNVPAPKEEETKEIKMTFIPPDEPVAKPAQKKKRQYTKKTK